MITIVGSVNLDFITNAERLPRPGETVLGGGFNRAAGGKGANQALAARRAGAEVRLVGRIGDDPEGTDATALLRQAGVNLDGLELVAMPTGTAHITVSADGENAIVVVPSANHQVTADDAKLAVGDMGEGDILLLQCEIPIVAVEGALVEARRLGVKTILNLAPMTAETKKLGALADVIVANETEFDLYCNGGERLDSERRIEKMVGLNAHTRQTIVVTLGGDGVVAVSGSGVAHVEGLRIKPVDTVGAGDTFCGYLAAGLAEGLELPAALRRAAVAGSLACKQPGAQPSIPAISEVLRNL